VFISMGSTVVCEQACSQVKRTSTSTTKKCRSPKLNEQFRARRTTDGYHLTFPYTVKIEGCRKMRDIKTAHLVSAAGEQERTSSPIAVLHIPHSSRQVPTEKRQGLRLDDAALNVIAILTPSRAARDPNSVLISSIFDEERLSPSPREI
jgi:hypothetical protein